MTEKKVCIIGLGYVGLPLAVEFGKFIETVGFDINKKRLEELKNVLDQSLNLRKSLLKNGAQNLKIWFCRVRKMKAVYHTMNLFNLEVNQKCLIAECWAPVSELTRIKLALDKGTVKNFKLELSFKVLNKLL